MTESRMIYGINDRPPFGKLILFGFQLMLSVFVATVLIAQICGVAVSGALFGAGLATIAYLLVTRWNSPMFVSNSGAFVAPVILALAAGGYTAVAVGGLVTCIVYCAFGRLFTKISVDEIYDIFPKALIGAVTMVIGITLMGFIGTYTQIDGEQNIFGIVIALFTAIVIAVVSHNAKGIARIVPFLIGTLAGYALAVLITVTGMTLFSVPDLAFSHWTFWNYWNVFPIILIYVAFTISAMMECLSDHAALGNIIGVDLYRKPGIGRIFVAEGFANLVGSVFGGLGICSYGEGVACVGFSRVASSLVTCAAAVMLMLLAFLTPVQAFIASIPSCVFGGASLILYGYIACSGVKMLQQTDLNKQKNLIMVSMVLSLGISGLAVGGAMFSLSGTSH